MVEVAAGVVAAAGRDVVAVAVAVVAFRVWRPVGVVVGRLALL